jgi:hypothetical protein
VTESLSASVSAFVRGEKLVAWVPAEGSSAVVVLRRKVDVFRVNYSVWSMAASEFGGGESEE